MSDARPRPVCNAVVVRGRDTALRPARRPGLREAVLLGRDASRHQNIVLVECDAGATVEMHDVATPESLIVLQGAFTLLLPEGEDDVTLETGDLAYFERGTQHGLRCGDDPGCFLLVFAPPEAPPSPSS